MTLYEELIQKIYHGHNPYTGFPVGQWAGVWYNDGGARRDIFVRVIEQIKPKLIVEVGSFVGESSIFMAEQLKRHRSDGVVLCIDTWLGGIDHWKSVPEKLRFHFGRPSLYYQFIGNVIQRGCHDTILPLTLDSLNAARLLKMLQIVPDMLYIDGSHEEGDVLADYEAYWPLLISGGAFLVDDLTGWFPGVLGDWKLFVMSHDLKVEVEGEKGLIIKA